MAAIKKGLLCTINSMYLNEKLLFIYIILIISSTLITITYPKHAHLYSWQHHVLLYYCVNVLNYHNIFCKINEHNNLLVN